MTKICMFDDLTVPPLVGCCRWKIANEFNNFFVSIGHNLAKGITCNVNPLIYVNSVILGQLTSGRCEFSMNMLGWILAW